MRKPENVDTVHTRSFKKKLVVVSIIFTVWVIMLCYTVNRIKFYNEANKNQEKIEQTGEIEPREVDISIWDTEKIEIYTDEAGAKVPVPKGYVVSGKDDEHTVNTGLVIYEEETPVTNENAWEESLTRNQWVWVPVPDVTRIYEEYNGGAKKSKLYSITRTGRNTYTNSNYEPFVLLTMDTEQYFARNGKQGMTQEKWLQEMQFEYERMIESVEKYGGYYIGRYETGDVSTSIPVVRRMNTSIYNVTWYKSYENLKKIKGTNEDIQTDVIWGCLWDETLQWLVDSGNKTYEELYNSKDWGNHYDSEFDYTTTTGETAHRNPKSSTRVPTGSAEVNKANNIYDLAGNVWEWTLERYGSIYRMERGGNCSHNASIYSVPYRNFYNPTFSYSNLGVRAYFYIK